MIYKFKSAASGNVIMLGPQGDALLRLLGREPAAKGIVEVRDLPAALAALRAASAGVEAPAAPVEQRRGEGPAADEPAVGLRQRLWPMIDMLDRAAAAGVPVVWGV